MQMNALLRTIVPPALLAAVAGSWPMPAAAEPATVLLAAVATNNPNSTPSFAEARLDIGGFETDALVFVTASGRADYAGALTGTGIRVSIRHGAVVVEDDMFEGQSINMTYRASVSHICLLPRGGQARLLGWTEALGPGTNNTQAGMRLEVVVIAAEFRMPFPVRQPCGGAS